MKIVKMFFLIILLLAICFVIISFYFLHRLKNYEKTSLEYVYSNEKLMRKIGNKKTPLEYGFEYMELRFESLDKKINLSGWYIPSENKNSEKCILLIHGLYSNRLEPLHYLKFFEKKDYIKEYSIFIPDLRNSGNSDSAETYMGYKFSEDIYSCILKLNEEKSKKEFIIYGFSTGGLASLLMYERFENELNKKSIKITDYILDSPLSNVKEYILYFGKKNKVPSISSYLTLFVFNIQIKKELYKMNLEYLLKKSKSNIFIIYSKKDEILNYNIFEKEMKKILKTSEMENNFSNYKEIKYKNLNLYIFEEGKHVEIYFDEKNEKEYEKIISEILLKK